MSLLDKNEVGERILKLELLLNKNTRQFAKSLMEKGDPSYLGKVEKGEKSLSKAYADSICKIYKVNRNWLLTGQGAIFTNGTNVPHETNSEINEHDAKSLYSPTQMRLDDYGALLSVIISELASIKSSISGENAAVITKKLYKAAEDLKILNAVR